MLAGVIAVVDLEGRLRGCDCCLAGIGGLPVSMGSEAQLAGGVSMFKGYHSVEL